jgi:cytochrome P450
VGLLFGSANHDPSVFPPTRRARHRPAGQPARVIRRRDPLLPRGALARLELATSLGTLLRRLPHMELVEEPEWKPGYNIRGLKELKVRV